MKGISLKRIDLDDGKFTLLHHEVHGGITVLKDGEVWSNRTDDELAMAMFNEIRSLKQQNQELRNLPVEKLDELQRSISVRKVETSEICYHEKLPKPNFNDLNWTIEQIYWIKKTL